MAPYFPSGGLLGDAGMFAGTDECFFYIAAKNVLIPLFNVISINILESLRAC
jgi:hypothetical protein